MRRREFVTLIGGAAVAWPLAVRAQQPAKVARVGFFRQAGPHDKQFNAFRDGLRAAGYAEGKNVLIEQRYAAGVYERLSGLAAELVRSNVDIIVVDGTAAAKVLAAMVVQPRVMRAARNATPGTATAVATSPRRIVDPPVGGLGQRRETGCWRSLAVRRAARYRW